MLTLISTIALVLLGAFVIWFLPILLIAGSDKTKSEEKLGWILAILFISWFAWILYLIFAPIQKD